MVTIFESSRYSFNFFVKTILFAGIFIIIIAYLPQIKSSHNFSYESHRVKARRTLPAELMSRPLAGAQVDIPKIFHQSWSSNILPAKFHEWSTGCREAHPDWEWVLWTDDDNLALVKKYMPFMLPAYEKLNGPIFRADMVRNMYMYLFGGVYADLDTDCLRSSDELFNRHNVSTSSASTQVTIKEPARVNSGKRVLSSFVGRMGTDAGFEHSIPNAWMASVPGHPLFKLILDTAQDKVMSGGKLDDRPEAITGPIALRDAIEEFNKRTALSPTALATGLDHYEAEVIELPFHYIYPYSWARDGDAFRDVCSSATDTFDAQRCKDLVAVDHWPSYTITYWSHTWNWEGPHEDNVKKISG